MIRSLKKQDLKLLYSYMSEDFPQNELKPLDMIERSFENGFMIGYGFYSAENQLMAYAMFVRIDKKLLFDYLAVLPKYRDQGIGSMFLGKLREILASYDYIVGEVENPEYCTDPVERQTMERRIQFYLKNGVLDTGASGRVYGVEYRFIELAHKVPHTKEEIIACMNLFYRTYWPEENAYHRYVQMH